MSRKKRDYVWMQYFNCDSEAICPVCEKNRMIRNDSKTWHREHILRCSLGGPDIFPNMIPICRQCNLGMGKECRTTFEFMRIKFGKITEEKKGIGKSSYKNV